MNENKVLDLQNDIAVFFGQVFLKIKNTHIQHGSQNILF